MPESGPEPGPEPRPEPSPARSVAGGGPGTASASANGIRFRPLSPTDANEVVDLLIAARAVDGPRMPVPRDELRHLWFDHPGTNLATDAIVGVAPDGTLAGVVGVFAREAPASVARAFIPGAVHPAYRRRGFGTGLLVRAEARARVMLGAASVGIPHQIDCETPADALDRIALFERRGFHRIRSFLAMDRELTEPLPSRTLPVSLTMTTWRPEFDDATRLAHNDAFRDHWGSDPLSPERWRHFVGGVPGFRPDCSWLAMCDDEVAGYTLTTVNDDPAGVRIGWLGTIGVRREWRHQGVASALIARSLASFVDAGATRAGLDVDAENPTGAVRVYGALGFRAGEESIIYSKRIDD